MAKDYKTREIGKGIGSKYNGKSPKKGNPSTMYKGMKTVLGRKGK